MIKLPGSYKISNEAYHQDPCAKPSLSRDVIKNLLFKSPAHAHHDHPRLNPDFEPEEEETKFDIGSASHPLLLEGNDIIEVIDAPDWRTKVAKEARAEARLKGKVPLLPPQYASVNSMVSVARIALTMSELQIANLQEEGDSELSYFWQEGGAWLKVRPDWISTDRQIILDYKTTTSANPNEFVRKVISMGYDIQEALYCRGVKAVEGITSKFIFMVQEIEPPYLCSFIALSPEFQDMGRKKVNQGIALWNQCMATGAWPGYPSRVMYLDMPAWAAMWINNATFIGNEEDEI
ncbi:MAG: PD-(D/E)XK nuclease-like domain-containing protein [Pseudomonadota bacterium]